MKTKQNDKMESKVWARGPLPTIFSFFLSSSEEHPTPTKKIIKKRIERTRILNGCDFLNG
jgi:hypothetical protein